MITLRCFLIAEYAATTADNRLTIAGTFDNLNVQRQPGTPPEALQNIAMPSAYLAVVTEASIADGLSHQLRLRILDGNGRQITEEETVIPVNYTLNRSGQPMRHNLVIGLNGIVLTSGPDDYVFELRVDGQDGPLGELVFSVTEITQS